MLTVVKPSRKLLVSYLDALREGDFITMQLGFSDASLAEIEGDPDSYIAKLNNSDPFNVELEGNYYKIKDHELLWITDGKRFLGTLALRYTGDIQILQGYAGHIGIAIRPALLNLGYGVRTIKQVFVDIVKKMTGHGLSQICITCAAGNSASSHLIEHFGGKLVDERPDVFGKGPIRRYELKILP